MTEHSAAQAVPPQELSPLHLRTVMGAFATGVTVLTMPGDEGPFAVTVNSFTSLSLNPALALVSLKTTSRAAAHLKAAGQFAINILSHEQAALSDRFARPSADDVLLDVAHHLGATGSPLIDGTLGFLECSVAQYLEAGDHTIFIGSIVSADRRPARGPLVFHSGRYHTTQNIA